MHGTEAPSAWVQRWTHLISTHATALGLACGAGRHMRWLQAQGLQVTGVDRSPEAIAACTGLGELICADIENGPWPLPGRQFGAVVVTNYLWRPLLPAVLASLAPGGVLIYETFAQGHETVGRPSRADFLLRPGELLQSFGALRTVAYEDGYLENPARFVQRIAAVRETPHPEAPARYRLQPLSS